ncbi:hypothetical protein [Pedobacter cryoconitis]|uniref:Uncharacterized protein n=1 Tax=Pedobacter cryoconitis TaxID=188932 RepID=A0A327T9E8_9SPHI|nr:hypothetical protein [Pedobacter cryoconitis]RAJ37005.1 hypothetical protein LY11_00080 [Pedobacter cryoconitis]
MDNIFSFQRFFKLLNKHTREHYKAYLISTAVLIGILSLMLGFTAYLGGGSLDVKAQFAYFFIFMFLSGTIFTSMVFADLSDKKRSIPALTLPVSNFERFFVGWVYSYLIFQVIFVTCYLIVDSLVIYLGNVNPNVKNELFSVVEGKNKFMIAFLIYGLLHAIAFLGAVFFEKLHFIKTAFVIFIMLGALQLINVPLISFFFKTNARMQPIFAGVSLQERNDYYFISPTDQSFAVLITMFLAVSIVLWAAAFFKLKEKQV